MVYRATRRPIRDFYEFQQAFDSLFDEIWNDMRSTTNWDGGISGLTMDSYETDDAYVIMVDLPGLNPDDIQVTLNDGALTISGEMPEVELPEGARWLRHERGYGSFQRSIRVPHVVDPDGIHANYENGVLTLTLNKAPEAQPRRITVSKGAQLESGS